MNKYDQYHSHPHNKRRQCRSKKNSSNRKLGLAMLLLGIITVLALFLPIKYWVLLLSAALVIFGIAILKSH